LLGCQSDTSPTSPRILRRKPFALITPNKPTNKTTTQLAIALIRSQPAKADFTHRMQRRPHFLVLTRSPLARTHSHLHVLCAAWSRRRSPACLSRGRSAALLSLRVLAAGPVAGADLIISERWAFTFIPHSSIGPCTAP